MCTEREKNIKNSSTFHSRLFFYISVVWFDYRKRETSILEWKDDMMYKQS